MIPQADTPSYFRDIDGQSKPGGTPPLEDYADQELKKRDPHLSALRQIAQLNHHYAKFAKLALEAAQSGQWPRAKTLWANRVCAF